MRHYHVHSGDHGYLPDSSSVHRTKAEAQGEMLDRKRQAKDAVFDSLPQLPARCKIFDGSLLAGEYECRYPRLAGLEYIELVPCWEPDCLEP